MDYRQSYIERDILEADGCKLILVMYRGAVEALGQARERLAAGDIAGRSRAITKVSEIVNVLALSLDHDAGGEVSRNLVELYDYVQVLLQKGNFEQIDPPLAEAQGLLQTLLEAWEHADVAGAGALQFSSNYASPAEAEHAPVNCLG